MIREISVQLPVDEVTESFIRDFTKKVRESKGSTLLRVNVFDKENHVTINLFSKTHKVSLDRALVDYLDENEINYSIA